MSVMLANAGTPLMWATAFHLFIGNALIGMAEGAMLCALFRFKRTTAGIVAIGLMVAANYASAWAGVFVFGNAARRFELDISNVPYFLLCAVAAAFLLSILLEFPFVLAAMWKEQRRIRKAIVGTLAVQVVSYAVLMLWYGSASSTSLITQTQSVPPAALSPPDNIVLFHIAADDGDVYRGTLLEPRQQKVYDADAMNPVDRVVARPSKNDPERWELCALRFRSGIREVEVIVIDRLPATFDAIQKISDTDHEENDWFNFGAAAQFNEAQEHDWKFGTGFWAAEGLLIENVRAGTVTRLALETPFASWAARSAIHLPNDQVLFQVGGDQICLLDPQSKQIALIARGRGMTAMLAE